MEIQQIVNEYFNSNSYLIQLSESSHIIVDPGNSVSELLKSLNQHSKDIKVFLTHEHTDHIIGLNSLKKDIEVFCSAKCAENIADSKQNYSYYSEDIVPFEITNKTHTFQNEKLFTFENFSFRFVETPGHSPGSVCIFFENGVFTGDTILNGTKTPLIFPHSNRINYKESIAHLLTQIKPGMTIYPGHGNPFVFNSIDDLYI